MNTYRLRQPAALYENASEAERKRQASAKQAVAFLQKSDAKKLL